MTFLGLEARTDLPKVSYPTALDFFVFLSFVFIFATILQFAVVHYFTKYGSGECYFNYYESSSDSENEETLETEFQSGVMSTSSHVSSMSQIDDIYGGVIPLSRLEFHLDEETRASKVFRRLRNFIRKYVFCMQKFQNDTQSQQDDSEESINNSTNGSEHLTESLAYSQNTPTTQRHQMRSSNRYQRTFNSVSKIDKVSRVVFPLLFFIINVIYWCFYLTRSQRK